MREKINLMEKDLTALLDTVERQALLSTDLSTEDAKRQAEKVRT